MIEEVYAEAQAKNSVTQSLRTVPGTCIHRLLLTVPSRAVTPRGKHGQLVIYLHDNGHKERVLKEIQANLSLRILHSNLFQNVRHLNNSG